MSIITTCLKKGKLNQVIPLLKKSTMSSHSTQDRIQSVITSYKMLNHLVSPSSSSHSVPAMLVSLTLLRQISHTSNQRLCICFPSSWNSTLLVISRACTQNSLPVTCLVRFSLISLLKIAPSTTISYLLHRPSRL